MDEDENVSRAEFQAFIQTYNKDTGELRALLTAMSSKLDSRHANTIPRSTEQPPAVSSDFHGCHALIPHPNVGRNKNTTSFVNVFAALKSGIEAYNGSIPEGTKKVNTNELDVPPLSWTHNAMSTVRAIVAKYKHLNIALGQESLDGTKKMVAYRDKPARYNRDVSAVLREIKDALPILSVAKSNWASRELLKNTFQNSKAAQKKRAQKRSVAGASNLEKSNAADGDRGEIAKDTDKHVVNSGQTQSQKPRKKLMPHRDVTEPDMHLHASEKVLQPNRESSKKPSIAKITGTSALRARDCKPIYIDEESDEDRVTTRVKHRTNSSLARRKVKAAPKQPKSKRKRGNRINTKATHGRKKRKVNTRKYRELEEEEDVEEYGSDDESDESNYAHEEEDYSEGESEE